jgi:hypothetical protein
MRCETLAVRWGERGRAVWDKGLTNVEAVGLKSPEALYPGSPVGFAGFNV